MPDSGHGYFFYRRILVVTLAVMAISGCSHLRLEYDRDGAEIVRGRELSNDGEQINFEVLHLRPTDADEKFPLLLLLPASGEDATGMIQVWKKTALDHRWMLVAADLSEGHSAEMETSAYFRILNEVAQKQPVDTSRIYVKGVSSGAFLARKLLLKAPDYWAGAALVASPSYGRWAQEPVNSKLQPILFVHGERDDRFAITGVMADIMALRAVGVVAGMMDAPDAGHEYRPEWNEPIMAWFQNPRSNQQTLRS